MGSVIFIVRRLGMQASLPSKTVGNDGGRGENFMFRALFRHDESLAYVGLVKPQKIHDLGSNGMDLRLARPQGDLEAARGQDNWISQQRALSKS